MQSVAYKSSISQHFFVSVFECVSDLRDGGVEAGDLQVWIRGWRSVPLHGDQPRRRNFVRVLRRPMHFKSTAKITQEELHKCLVHEKLSCNFTEQLPCVKSKCVTCVFKTAQDEALTGPVGIPRATRSSADRSPGFFSFSRVSNSLP